MSDCIFCQLIQKNQNIHFSDQHLVILNDTNPQAPIHQLIIPKKHIATLNDVTVDDTELMGHLIATATQQASLQGIGKSGFRLIFNCNPQGGQAVYHIHLHLLGGRNLTWPPG